MEDEDLPDTRVFVTGLPPNLTSAELGKHFAGRYQITDAHVVPGRRIGFVGFRNYTLAKSAIKYFNKSYIRMSKITVDFARPIELDRPDGQQAQPKSNRTLRTNTNVTEDSLQPSAASRSSFQPYVPVTKAASSLKRKRETEDNSKKDEALEEYLDLVQPSKVRQHKDKATLESENARSTLVEGKDLVASTNGAEDSADKEHGKDKKSKKTKEEKSARRAAKAAKAEALSKDAAVEGADASADMISKKEKNKNKKQHRKDAEERDGSKGGNITIHDSVITNGVPADANQPTITKADDDEWLRSKTSRVLDLVDEPEFQPTAQTSRQAAQVKDNSEITDGSSDSEDDTSDGLTAASEELETAAVQPVLASSTTRLFVRNLPYSTSESDLMRLFSASFRGETTEIHMVKDSRTNINKGFAYVSFVDSESAHKAALEFDGKPMQGRILHVLPATDKASTKLDDFDISKLPLKKQKLIKRKAEAGVSTLNWNSLYLNSDAVISSIADRLGVAKSQVLDPTSSDAAVKQAQAETHMIQETKTYFSKFGVDFDSFKDKPRGGRALLVKNLAHGTTPDDLKTLFGVCGEVIKVLLPPSGVLGIVEFEEIEQAQRAMKQLAYRNLKGSVLYLERAPRDVLQAASSKPQGEDSKMDDAAENTDLPESASFTLFVRNLNFSTTSAGLSETFRPLDGFLSAKVKTRTDSKRPGEILSMGYGFVDFRSKQQAQTAMKAMNGYTLDNHELTVKFSQNATDAAEERRREDNTKKTAATRTKIIIKNLPFEATKKDIRSLFGAYGQLRSVRVPQKFDRSTRGFAFAEFVTAREAENAMDALKNTHLLGRRLVLEFATADVTDPEEEIRAMEKKVGRQVERVEVHKLAGPGRRKVVLGARDDMEQD